MPTNPLTNTVKRKLITLGIHGTMRPVHYALRHGYPEGKSLDRATRRQDLLNLLKMFGAIQTTDLQTIFGFSDFTIREMARELAGDGLIVIRSDYPAPRDGRRGGRAPKWLQTGYDTLSTERLDQLRQAAQILLEYQPVRRAELERERAERQARIDAWAAQDRAPRPAAQALERPAQEIPPAPAQDQTLLHAQDHDPRHAQDRTPLYAQEPAQERVEGPDQNPAQDMDQSALQPEVSCFSTCDSPAPALAESHAQEWSLDTPPARLEPCSGPPKTETRTLPPVVAAQVQQHQEQRTKNQEPRTENREHGTILPRQPRPVAVRSGHVTPYAQRPLLPMVRIEDPIPLRDRWSWLDGLLRIGEDLRYGLFGLLELLDLVRYELGRALRALWRVYRRIINNPEPTIIRLMVVATIWVIVWASQWSLGWQLPSWVPGARTPPGAAHLRANIPELSNTNSCW